MQEKPLPKHWITKKNNCMVGGASEISSEVLTQFRQPWQPAYPTHHKIKHTVFS
jgi:hypothetical protein